MSLVELARFPAGHIAEIWRGRLAAEDITAFCLDSGMNIADGAAIAIPVRLMVLEEDMEEARMLLEKWERYGNDDEESGI